MEKIYHIGRFESDLATEGGVSRDLAFSRLLDKHAIRIRVSNSRLRNIYVIFKFLLFSPKFSTVVIHYPNIGLPVSDKVLVGRVIRVFYASLVDRVARNNQLCVDVADIPCEQAVDLGLPIPSYYEDIEFRLLNAATVLMPASAAMAKLIISKYPPLSEKKIIVCNNGGEKLPGKTQKQMPMFSLDHKIKFVYAGTLNKGRNIENLIEVFESSKHTLYLLGAGGSWVPNAIQHASNIFYLGELPESEALNFVSDCDIGLIPYDSSRYYYNVAYPTKLSFYLSAGVPYLCTPVTEALAVYKKYQCGWIYPFDQWQAFIEGLDSEDVYRIKMNTYEKREIFTWANTLKPFLIYLGLEASDPQ